MSALHDPRERLNGPGQLWMPQPELSLHLGWLWSWQVSGHKVADPVPDHNPIS